MRLRTVLMPLLAGSLLVGPLAMPAPASAEALCGHEVVSIEQMVRDIQAKAGGRVSLDNASFVAVDDPANMILWTFAKPSGGRFPAYICRKVVQEDGKVVQLRALCRGPKPECDALIASVLDQQQKATQSLRR